LLINALFNAGSIQAQLRTPDRSHIATRTTTNDDDVIVVSHNLIPSIAVKLHTAATTL
jgi:hypothetical protein